MATERKKRTTRTKTSQEPPIKRLYRSNDDVILGGVCAGIAEYTNTDPTLIRILWIIASVLSGFFLGIITYIIVWAIMPIRPANA